MVQNKQGHIRLVLLILSLMFDPTYFYSVLDTQSNKFTKLASSKLLNVRLETSGLTIRPGPNCEQNRYPNGGIR